MTGGTVVVLGEVGRNFGAGMSGGQAYVYDVSGQFSSRVNAETIDLEALDEGDDKDVLRHLLQQHQELTGSITAQFILSDWDQQLQHFVKVFPKEYKRALAQKKQINVTVQ